MVRAAVLASGDGVRLQMILDAVYFNEIPNFELVAVICPQRSCFAMSRAISAGIPAYVVDPELFPNMTTHSMAVANKLLGVVPYQFKNRIIGTYPALYPAFSEEEGDLMTLTLESGLKVTGATAFFSDGDGHVGAVISQKALVIATEETPESLASRLMEECEWPLLKEAITLFCSRRLSVRGKQVEIKPPEDE